jgi:hypothetical protein
MVRLGQWAACALAVLFVSSILGGSSAGEPGAGSAWMPARGDWPLAARLQEAWGVDALEVPADTRSLGELVAVIDARFDVTREPAALLVIAGLDPALLAAVRDLLAVVVFVQDVRDDEFAGVSDAEISRFLATESADEEALALLDGVDHERLRAATVALASAVDRALPVLKAHAVERSPLDSVLGVQPPLVDLAPALVMDPLGVDNLFNKDAVLMIDLGGNDVYDANAGGALIHRGLVGDPGSCQHHAGGFSVGCENEDSFESFTASLLIDVLGDDQYGVYKPPRSGSRDAICGPEPIIRRVVTYGSGSGGIGMLVDVAGDDAFHGKTLSMGHGHLAGVGAFFDLGGTDHFQAVRSSMGSAILQGSGYFLSAGGDDLYLFKAPSGGLFNVDRGRCDRTERLGLGSGIIQGTAHFVSLGGADRYVIQSQALGHVESQSVAHFADVGGVDDYGGYPGRADNTIVYGAATFVDQN